MRKITLIQRYFPTWAISWKFWLRPGRIHASCTANTRLTAGKAFSQVEQDLLAAMFFGRGNFRLSLVVIVSRPGQIA